MTRSGNPQRLRRYGVSLVLAVLVAIPYLAAHDARAAQRPTQTVSVSTAADGPRIPDVARNVVHVPLLVSARPVRMGHPGLDGLVLVGFVIAFGVTRRRASLSRGERFRFDARFAPRRGPPSIRVI